MCARVASGQSKSARALRSPAACSLTRTSPRSSKTRDKRSPFYAYDFQIDGHRFHGSTKETSRREAEQKERDLKRDAKEQIRQSRNQQDGPLTIDLAAGRYWQEIGQHHSGADNTWRDLERLVGYFGPGKRLADIGDNDVAKLIAWRRGHRVKAYWRRCRKKAGVADYRWHDNRHTSRPSCCVRPGTLKLVQNALHHARIETTIKYAHVLDDELRAGMEKADRARESKSRNKSRRKTSPAA